MKNAMDPTLEINDKLFREVRAAIKKDKQSFCMGSWCQPIYNNGQKEAKAKEMGHVCFSTACMAGWGVFLGNKKSLIFLTGKRKGQDRYPDYEAEAKKLFGINQRQADHLFYGDRWPLKYRLMSWDSKIGEVKAAVRLITDFLKVKGDLSQLYDNTVMPAEYA